MKVLMTADAVGGVWTYVLELAQALAPSGVRVTLATMGDLPSDSQRAAAASVPGLSLYTSEYRLEWMPDPWQDVARAGEWLLELADRERPDLIHLNGYAHGSLPWPAPVLAVGHSCVLSWWDAVKGVAAPGEWDRYRREVAGGLRGADMVAAPTRAMLHALSRHYGPLRCTRTIPNGRRPAAFVPAEKEPLILAAGRLWDEAKNIGMLARAAAGLPWPAYVAGDDRHPAGGCARGESLQFLGWLTEPELGRWLGRASIYALPARYEPFGLSVLEAAFAGCALVLGDIPSLREVWQDAAVFVSPDNPDRLRAELLRLIECPASRRELGERARRKAFEYTPERMAAGYLTTYRYLTGTQPVAESSEALEEAACV